MILVHLAACCVCRSQWPGAVALRRPLIPILTGSGAGAQRAHNPANRLRAPWHRHVHCRLCLWSVRGQVAFATTVPPLSHRCCLVALPSPSAPLQRTSITHHSSQSASTTLPPSLCSKSPSIYRPRHTTCVRLPRIPTPKPPPEQPRPTFAPPASARALFRRVARRTPPPLPRQAGCLRDRHRLPL